MQIITKLFPIVFSVIILFTGCDSASKDNHSKSEEEKLQVAIYDKDKEAIAYIDYEDEATIYTFEEGEPVAYIVSEELVYGFNGKLLGWYSDGVIYDRTYYAVGAKQGIAREGINTVVTRPEKVKHVKRVKPVKHVRENSLTHPLLKNNWSETTLPEFFANGKK